MAEDSKDHVSADQPVTTGTSPQEQAPQPPAEQQAPHYEAASDTGRNKTVLLLIGIIFALTILMYGAFVAGRQSVNKQNTAAFGMRSSSGDVQLSPDQVGNSSGGTNNTNGYGPGPRGGMMQGGLDQDTDTTNASRISGVVTAVSGDTITVAGGGTTTKVTVSSDTNYSGSSEPAKVNDTITAVGTKNSDGSLTATSVRLYRS